MLRKDPAGCCLGDGWEVQSRPQEAGRSAAELLKEKVRRSPETSGWMCGGLAPEVGSPESKSPAATEGILKSREKDEEKRSQPQWHITMILFTREAVAQRSLEYGNGTWKRVEETAAVMQTKERT